jgi:hypothetical protein
MSNNTPSNKVNAARQANIVAARENYTVSALPNKNANKTSASNKSAMPSVIPNTNTVVSNKSVNKTNQPLPSQAKNVTETLAKHNKSTVSKKNDNITANDSALSLDNPNLPPVDDLVKEIVRTNGTVRNLDDLKKGISSNANNAGNNKSNGNRNNNNSTNADNNNKKNLLPPQQFHDMSKTILDPKSNIILTNMSGENLDQLLGQFMHTLHDLLNKLYKSFKCPHLGLLLEQVRISSSSANAQEHIIKSWYNEMKVHMPCISEGNVEAFLNLPVEKIPSVLKDLNIREKFYALKSNDGNTEQGKPSTRQRVIDQIEQLNKCSALYVNIPSSTRKTLENVASNVAQNYTSIKSINGLNIKEMGVAALGKMTERDVSDFIGNIGNIYEAAGGEDALRKVLGEGEIAKDVGEHLNQMQNDPVMKQAVMNEFKKSKQQPQSRTAKLNAKTLSKKWKPKQIEI